MGLAAGASQITHEEHAPRDAPNILARTNELIRPRKTDWASSPITTKIADALSWLHFVYL
jgi:hypothetical protein